MATDKRPTTLRLPKELYTKIKYLSDYEHRSVNMQIEHALLAYVKNYEKKHGEIPSTDN